MGLWALLKREGIVLHGSIVLFLARFI